MVITDNRERIYDLEIGSGLGKADNSHLSISWKFEISSGKEAVRFIRNKYNYRTGDYDGMNQFFLSMDWEANFIDRDSQETYTEFLLSSAYISQLFFRPSGRSFM